MTSTADDTQQICEETENNQEQAPALSKKEIVDEPIDSADDSKEAGVEEVDEVVMEDSVRAQLDAAIAHIQDVGKQDGQVLVKRITDTFAEFNDREPTSQELKQIFGRVKGLMEEHATQSFGDEAKQKISYKQAAFADVIGQPDAIRGEVIRAAQSVVLEDLQVQACRLFLDMNLRVPTAEELRSGVKKLAFDLFGKTAENTVEDPDYDPNNAEDQAQEVQDLIEDADDAVHKTKKYFYYGQEWRNKLKEIQSYSRANKSGYKPAFDSSVDERKSADAEPSQEKRTTTVKAQVEMLTTPVREKKNACRMDIYFEKPESAKRMESAKKQLSKITQGEVPSEGVLSKFMDGGNVALEAQQVNVEFEQEVVNQENVEPSAE